MSVSAREYLSKYSMNPEMVDPTVYAPIMAEAMKKGLNEHDNIPPMIPTYLRCDGNVPLHKPVVVIDAGGTNFRTGLVTFTEDGYITENVNKRIMPGIGRPATWESFISLVADSIQPLLEKADDIGFCFSYSAEITPEIDGRVIRIDKEVIINGCEGRYVGADLLSELEERGITGKHIVILNDTAAVLLGGSASLDKSQFGGLIGQVSGTGTNTCCVVPQSSIGKLEKQGEGSIIINCESGMCDCIPRGRFDIELDEESANPGSKFFEKQTAGVYLGELSKLILNAAADEGIFSEYTALNVRKIFKPDSSVIDAWSVGENLDDFCDNDADRAFIREVADCMFERSARCMCTNILAIELLTGEGKDPAKPVCVCAEGSLVQKSRRYRPKLEEMLKICGEEGFGIYTKLVIGNESTLPGSAAAALLNR